MAAAVFRAAALALACGGCTTVAVDGRTFEGGWRVMQIDGRMTPANGNYRIAFENGRISGRFGCNGWGGTYAIAGATLTASQVVSTKMACPEPAMSFETQGLAVLQQPMRWTWTGQRRLTLTNDAGSIGIERLP
jgi:putative lipoprotein